MLTKHYAKGIDIAQIHPVAPKPSRKKYRDE